MLADWGRSTLNILFGLIANHCETASCRRQAGRLEGDCVSFICCIFVSPHTHACCQTPCSTRQARTHATRRRAICQYYHLINQADDWCDGSWNSRERSGSHRVFASEGFLKGGTEAGAVHWVWMGSELKKDFGLRVDLKTINQDFFIVE